MPPGRPDALAAALERLVDDAELRRSLGARGRETVLRAYGIRAIGQQLRDIAVFLRGGSPPDQRPLSA